MVKSNTIEQDSACCGKFESHDRRRRGDGKASRAPVETPSSIEAGAPAEEFFYVYCVVDGAVSEKFGKMGIGARGDEVYAMPCKDISAIVSRTDHRTFERDEENMLAHQRVVQKVFGRFPAVPLQFSSVLENVNELFDFLSSLDM